MYRNMNETNAAEARELSDTELQGISGGGVNDWEFFNGDPPKPGLVYLPHKLVI